MRKLVCGNVSRNDTCSPRLIARSFNILLGGNGNPSRFIRFLLFLPMVLSDNVGVMKTVG